MNTPEKKYNLMIIGTSDREQLVNDVVQHLTQLLEENIEVEIIPNKLFMNGECSIELLQSARGKHVYGVIDVNSHAYDGLHLNDRYMLGKLMLDGAKQYGAKTINALYTCFPYARADKPTHYGNKSRGPRKPSSARRIVIETESLGVDRCITLDIHNPATMEIFRSTKGIDLPTGWLIEEVMNRIQKDNLILCGADQGGDKKINPIAEDLQVEHAIALKKRDHSKPNTVQEIHVFGDIEGKDALIHDDMLDTGGTFIKLLEAIREQNPRSVNAVMTHGLLNGEAFERLESAHKKGLFETLYITDTVYHETLPPYIQVIDTSFFFADKIASTAKGESIDYNRNEVVVMAA